MPRFLRLILALVAVLAVSVRAWSDEAKRVAVLADATALGVGQQARLNAWPVQLGRMLGGDWLVRGFARGAASLDPSAQRFVLQLPEWEHLQAFNPDVVVVSLGASDAVEATFRARERVPAGLDAVLSNIATLPRKPPVFVCLPPPPQKGWLRAAPYETAIAQLTQLLREAAQRHGATVVDTHAPLVGKEEHLVSGFMPDAEGGQAVAAAVYMALTSREAPKDVGPYRRTAPPEGLSVVDFVRDGKPVRAVGANTWNEIDGALQAKGGESRMLLAPIETGKGDFSMVASVWIEGGEGNGPRLGLDGNWITLESAMGNVSADGDLFHGRPYIARTNDVVKRGAWMTLEVRRVGTDVEFLADGELLIVDAAPGEQFGRFAIDPRGSQMKIRSWTVGTRAAPKEPEVTSTTSPAPAPKP
ncbi:MAG: GDSL-type esterase/lipase family protein [Phycisphaerales bacterium]